MLFDVCRQFTQVRENTFVVGMIRAQLQPVAFRDGQRQFQRIDGIQSQPAPEQRRLRIDVVGRMAFQVQAVDDDLSQFVFGWCLLRHKLRYRLPCTTLARREGRKVYHARSCFKPWQRYCMNTPQPGSFGLVTPRQSVGLPGLSIEHVHGDAREPLDDPRMLAVFGFGAAAGLVRDPRCLHVALEPLHMPAPLEVWRAHNPVSTGHAGPVAWASDGDYGFAWLELDETSHGGIATASREAYRLMRAWCATSPTPHLLRIWNYIDAINLGDGDDERYRQFCSGRAAGMAGATDAVYPAATAIGVRDGRRRVQVCWLAARQPGSPWENPRQVSAWRYPRRYGPAAPGFARGMRAPVHDEQLYVSGTAAVVGHASHHVGDARAQVDETLSNLDCLLDAAGVNPHARRCSRSVWRVYVRHAEHAREIESRIRDRFGDAARLLMLGGDICRAELLVEIDGIHGA